ncbi:MAG TPA: hypothetical protein PKC67_04085 [Kiritimatiellia bacterium]|nr:hypothetical protein [Kiritimatiellia bacterium]HMP33508.1 hypothetical protein [Kiritimatiellia bacterium]
MSGTPTIAYGLDLDGGHATIVRARRRGRSIHLETLASHQPLPALADTLRSLAAEQARDKAAIALAAPAQDSVLRTLNAPFASLAKARAVLPSLLDVQLPFPLEQCACHFILAPQPRGEPVRATAVAMPNDRVAALLATLQSAGLDPDLIDHEAVALWRQAAPPPGESTVVLYLGEERTVAVSGRSEPAAVFSARTGWRTGDHASTERLLARLRPFLAGLRAGSEAPDPHFILAGPLARTATASVAERLDLPADHIRLAEHAESMLARSLARAALAPDAWSVNLRTGDHEHPNLPRRRTAHRARRHTRVRLAALLAIAAGLGLPALVEQRHTRAQAAVQEQAFKLTDGIRAPRGQELFVVDQVIAEARSRYAPFNAWLEPTAYPLFAALLTDAAARDQRLETLSVRAASALIRGSGTDWSDPERLARPLAAAGWPVEIERAEAGLDERVHYTVRAGR